MERQNMKEDIQLIHMNPLRLLWKVKYQMQMLVLLHEIHQKERHKEDYQTIDVKIRTDITIEIFLWGLYVEEDEDEVEQAGTSVTLPTDIIDSIRS